MPTRRFIRMRCIQTNNQKTINHRKYLNAKYLKNIPKFIIDMISAWGISDYHRLCFRPRFHAVRTSLTRESYVWSSQSGVMILWKVEKFPLEAIFGSYDTQTRVHSITRTLLLKVSSSKIDLFNFLIIISNGKLSLIFLGNDSKLLRRVTL